jgi:hypothetical protein
MSRAMYSEDNNALSIGKMAYLIIASNEVADMTWVLNSVRSGISMVNHALRNDIKRESATPGFAPAKMVPHLGEVRRRGRVRVGKFQKNPTRPFRGPGWGRTGCQTEQQSRLTMQGDENRIPG